jgi:hypothetical protein
LCITNGHYFIERNNVNDGAHKLGLKKHLPEKYQHPASQSVSMNNDSNKGVGDHRHVHFAPMAEMYEFEENCGDEQISNTLWYSVRNFPRKLSSSAYCILLSRTRTHRFLRLLALPAKRLRTF